MRRFRKLVRIADERGMTPREITEAIFGDEVDWSQVVAAWWMYQEDGGRKWKYEDFLECIEELLETEGYTPSDLVWKVATSCEKRLDR